MAELEEKLSAILGDPQAMGQIMALARSLSGEEARPEGEQPPQARPEEGGPGMGEGPDLASALGQLDPELVRTGMRLLTGAREAESRSAALLSALRPFLKESRRARLDRALELAQVIRLVRTAMESGEKRGEDGDV